MVRTFFRRLLLDALQPACFPVVHLCFCILMLSMLWFVFHTLTDANHSLHVRLARCHLQDALLTEETGQRGYLLTGQREYWEQFDTGRQRVPIYTTELEMLISSNPANYRHLQKAQELLKRKEEELQHTIVLFDARREKEAILVVRSNQGEEFTREITAELNQIDQEAQSSFWTCFAWLSTSLLPLLGIRSSFLPGR